MATADPASADPLKLRPFPFLRAEDDRDARRKAIVLFAGVLQLPPTESLRLTAFGPVCYSALHDRKGLASGTVCAGTTDSARRRSRRPGHPREAARVARDEDRSVASVIRRALDRELERHYDAQEGTMKLPGRRQLEAEGRYAKRRPRQKVTAGTDRHGVVDDGNIAWPERVEQARRRLATSPGGGLREGRSAYGFVDRATGARIPARARALSIAQRRHRIGTRHLDLVLWRATASASSSRKTSHGCCSGLPATSAARWCRWRRPAPQGRVLEHPRRTRRVTLNRISWVETVPRTPPPVDGPLVPFLTQADT